MNILHVLDSCGMYGKENVVKSLLDTIGGKALNLSDITTFEQSVKEDQLISSTESKIGKLRSYINANEDGLVHCHDFKSGILSLYYKYFGFKKTKIIRTVHGWTAVNKLSKRYLYKIFDKLTLPFYDKSRSKTFKYKIYRCVWNHNLIYRLARHCVLDEKPKQQSRTVVNFILIQNKENHDDLV